MHTYLSNGICSVELYNFVQVCKDNGFRDIFPHMEESGKSDWCFPHAHASAGKQVHTMFCKERAAASKEHWQCSASETLTGYPLIRHFAEQIVSVAFPDLQKHVASLVLSFKVLDILQDTKGGAITVALLRKAIVEHLEQHRSVYGLLGLLPKHHLALHLPQQIARDKTLTDTFVVERSFLLPRRVANEIDNSTSFEKPTISRVILARMSSLDSFDERVGFTGKDAAMCPELSRALGADVAVAAGAHIDGIRIQRDDVLLVDGYTIKLSAVCKSGCRY